MFRTVAQTARHCIFTAETRVQFVDTGEVREDGRIGTAAVSQFSAANHQSTLLHIYLSPPHQMCGSPDQAAHYHNPGPKLRASSVTPTLSWSRSIGTLWYNLYT
jgi:hypothetical protein